MTVTGLTGLAASRLTPRRLTPSGPHDVAWSLWFLGAHAVPGLETWDGVTYRRMLPVGGRQVAVALTADGGDLLVEAPTEADPAVRELLGSTTTRRRPTGTSRPTRCSRTSSPAVLDCACRAAPTTPRPWCAP